MKDQFTSQWITSNAIGIIRNYEKGILTLRGLHYQLVGIGMTNTLRHYKRVVQAMINARWDGLVEFDVFSDHDRSMIGYTKADRTDVDDQISKAKGQLQAWMQNYNKNRWENQPIYPEVFIEKKALQGVFDRPCRELGVAMGACKGYPSLTFLNESFYRFQEAIENGKRPVILYFGDYDPSGEDIPRSILDNLERLGCLGIEVRRIALMEHQVLAWKLPPAPVKKGDSRAAKWTGLGQVELDAVKPEKLQALCREAIDSVFDEGLHEELLEREQEERSQYRSELRIFVDNNL